MFLIGDFNSFGKSVEIDAESAREYRAPTTVSIGNHCSFGNKVKIGANCKIGDAVVIEDGVQIAANTVIGTGTIITANSQIGFPLMQNPEYKDYPTIIGCRCLIESSFIGRAAEVRSGSHIAEKRIIGDSAIIAAHSFIDNDVVPFTVCTSEGMVNTNRAMLRKLEWYDADDAEGFSILGSVLAQACKQTCADGGQMYLEDRAYVRSGEKKAVKSMIAFFENQIFHEKAFGKKSSIMKCLML